MFGIGIQEIIPIIIIFFIFLIPAVLWLWALVDILKSEFKGHNKIIWLLLVIFVPVVGFILYFLIGKKQKVLTE
jgi:hypothetical protein